MAHILIRGFTANHLASLRAGLFRSSSSFASSSPSLSSSASRVGKSLNGSSTYLSKPTNTTVVKRNFMNYFYQNRLLRQSHLPAGGPVAPRTGAAGWVARFLGDKPEYARYTSRWWWDKTVMCVVFAITGSTTAYFVRPFVEQVLHLDGSFLEGPWSYRIAYLVTITPIYSFLLVLVGTLFGRHAFFKKFAKRMWTRMIPRF